MWVSVYDAHFNGTTREGSIRIGANGSQISDASHAFRMLIPIEKGDCLVSVMKRGVYKKNSTCLDHKKEVIDLWPVRKRRCEIKCLPGGPDLPCSA
jgi:hypothetical protein